MTEQHATPVADTDAGPTEPPPKKASRAGRDLPAAIAVGVVLGGMAIGVLFFAPIGWLPVLSIFIPIATHEVVRRLREAGYALPVIPLLIPSTVRPEIETFVAPLTNTAAAIPSPVARLVAFCGIEAGTRNAPKSALISRDLLIKSCSA